MSIACIENYLGNNWQNLIAELKNGECRLLALNPANNLNANGFPSENFAPRTSEFLPCVWNPKSRNKSDAEEVIAAAQTRARAVYEIQIAQTINSQPVAIESSDRLEMRLKIGGVSKVMEILTVTNESNIAWLIYATDITI